MKYSILFAPLVLAICLAPDAPAQCPRVYQQTYVAPTYSYTPTYYAPTYSYAYVPFVLKVPSYQPFAYSVNDTLPALNKALDILAEAQRQGGLLTPRTAPTPRTPAAGPAVTTPPGDLPGEARGPAGGVKALLATKCVSCHGGALGTGLGIDLRNPDAVPRDIRLACLDVCRLGDYSPSGRKLEKVTGRPLMPKEADTLSADEVALLLAWHLETNAPPAIGWPAKKQ